MMWWRFRTTARGDPYCNGIGQHHLIHYKKQLTSQAKCPQTPIGREAPFSAHLAHKDMDRDQNPC